VLRPKLFEAGRAGGKEVGPILAIVVDWKKRFLDEFVGPVVDAEIDGARRAQGP
jgi:hypothetical protein